jgi:hypothetical protein
MPWGNKKSYDAAVAEGKDPHENCRKKHARLQICWSKLHDEQRELFDRAKSGKQLKRYKAMKKKEKVHQRRLGHLQSQLDRATNRNFQLRKNNEDIKTLYKKLLGKCECLRDAITEANMWLAETVEYELPQRPELDTSSLRSEEEAAGIYRFEVPPGGRPGHSSQRKFNTDDDDDDVPDDEVEHSDASTLGPHPDGYGQGGAEPEAGHAPHDDQALP